MSYAARARTLRGVADDLGAPLGTRQKLDALTKRREKSQAASDARYLREYEERARAFIRKRRESLLQQVQALDRLERRLDGGSPRTPKSKSPKSKSPKTPKSKSPKTPKSKSPKRRLTFVDA